MRLRKCRECGGQYKPISSDSKACSIDCAITVAKKEKAKTVAKEEQIKQQEAKRRLSEMKTQSELIQDYQKAFNEFIRYRDWGKPCISCQAPHTGKANSFDAGHYRSVGSAPHVRFDERNVHGQCKRCNRYGFDSVAYRDGLIAKIGIAQVESLESENAAKHYTKEQLRELIAMYRQKAKELSFGR